MPLRITKINKHIQRTFGEILQREADMRSDALVTISKVDTTPNLQSSIIWLYVSPPNLAKKVLQSLQDQIYDLQGSLNRKLHLNPLPRITLRIDKGADDAQNIKEALATEENKSSNQSTKKS